MLKKIKNSIIYLVFVGLMTLFLLELCFRFYVVDFYRGHLEGLNPKELVGKPGQSAILIIGDSFTADPDSYVRHLRENLVDHQIVNAAIPGTCITQHRLLVKSRVREFKPDILIYQVYVGNDLLEFRHPTKNADISLTRKIYWYLADRILVLAFINAQLPALRQAILHDLPTKTDPKALEIFSPEKYSARSKLQFRAEPDLLQNTILLQGGRKKDMVLFTKEVNQMLQQVPDACDVYVLVMPHCIQINNHYITRLTSVGAKITLDQAILATEYPFIEYLKTHLDSSIHIINPLEKLKEEERIAPVYYGNDPHLNSFGQAVVAKLCTDQL